MTSSLVPDTLKYDLQLQLQACQSRSRRNGKVARLPAALRDQLNAMMDDGFAYKQIIQKLGPAGAHLNEDNLSNWRLGGYQDYLKAQAINERALVETQAAADALRALGSASTVQLKQVCGQIALVKYIRTILQYGEQTARQSLQKNPAKFITLMNACCNMANASIALEKRRLKDQAPTAPPAPIRT